MYTYIRETERDSRMPCLRSVFGFHGDDSADVRARVLVFIQSYVYAFKFIDDYYNRSIEQIYNSPYT